MNRESDTSRHNDALTKAVDALEAQRPHLGDEMVDAMIAAVLGKLAGRPAEQEERRALVTVLFADLVGFTALSSTVDPEDVKDLMKAYFSRCSGAIRRFGGHVEKYIGDAVMAVFGIGEDSEDAPANAVRAGLEIVDAVRGLQAQLRRATDPRPAVRVGISTGVVLLDRRGGGEDVTVVGDTVNTASRLQTAAESDTVLIGSGTYAHVSGLFGCEARGTLALKGKSEPVEAFRVVSSRPRSFHAVRHESGFEAPTIGRERELAALQEAFTLAASHRRLRWVTICGDAGVGKSRLVEELEAWLADHPERVWFFKGRGWAHTQRTPYFVLRDIIASRCDIGDDEPLHVACTKLKRMFCDGLGAQGEEAAAVVGHLVGIDFGGASDLANVADARQIRGRAEVLLRRYFAALAQRGPVVLLLEDLHWADDQSLEMLSALLSDPPPGPLCAVAATRPMLWERFPVWGEGSAQGKALHRRIDVSPLPAEAAQTLAVALLAGKRRLPAWLLGLLVQRGEGNPYFTEELARWLIEQGVVTSGPDGYEAAEDAPEELVIPTTVQAVLQARLERLGAPERTTLECAGVVGRIFWSGGVAHLRGASVPTTQWDLLQGRDLIVAHPVSQVPAEREFRFKHVLLRDVVYECTLKRTRRVLHAKAAEWLLAKLGDRAAEWAPVVADHYANAGMSREAALWFAKAGDAASKTAPAAAVAHYQKALELLGDAADEETITFRRLWHEGLGESLFATEKYEDAAEACDTVIHIAAAQGDAIGQARALNLLAETKTPRADYEGVIACADAALSLTEGAGQAGRPQRIRALSVRGWGCRWLGRFDEARSLGLASLDLAMRLGDDQEISYAANLLGAVELSTGHCREAVRRFEESLAASQRRKARLRMLTAFSNLGETARVMGDFAQAVTWFERAVKEARELSFHHGERLYRSNLGGARVGMGEFALAEEDLREALSGADPAWYALGETYAFLAEALLGLGRPVEACVAVTEALRAAREGGPEVEGIAWRTAGLIAGSLERPLEIDGVRRDARWCFRRSLETIAHAGIESERGWALRAWGVFECTHGDKERGRALLADAEEVFRASEMVWTPPACPRD
ncbi:AAA family ATPase [Candidatus Fermentibacteria bacterium]|nr:AAA family ATPase [Candidatus Fermentibacteria bacterium]